MSKLRYKYLDSFLQIFFFLILIFLIEGISLIALTKIQSNDKATYISFPNFIASKPLPFLNVDDFEEVKMSYGKGANKCRGKIIYEESLGFPRYQKDNFKCPGEELKNGRRVTIGQPRIFSKKIMMFGGSTIWGSGSADRNTIPSLLQKNINEKISQRIKVINYGFSTVTINQQLNLLNSTRINEGDIVVFYDGGNDIFQTMVNENFKGSIIGYNQKNKLDIYLHNIKFFLSVNSNTYRLISSIRSSYKSTPNINCNINDENKSKKLMSDGFEYYLSRIELAKIYVESNGGIFFHFLQPSLFHKDLKYSEYEKELIKQSPLGINECEVYLIRVQNGYKHYSSEYNKKAEIKNLKNLTNILDSVSYQEEYFIDNLHITSSGNALVSNSIFQTIQESIR